MKESEEEIISYQKAVSPSPSHEEADQRLSSPTKRRKKKRNLHVAWPTNPENLDNAPKFVVPDSDAVENLPR